MNERVSGGQANLLAGTRVYLSGPMDFVGSREHEARYGWRSRIGGFLRHHGCQVFDPWNKPEVRGLYQYGREEIETVPQREQWTFEDSPEGARIRSELARDFSRTMHIDLRMVDVSDFVIAYCPTNIYSVGTPHEIVVARQQHKPVLFVSPPIDQQALTELEEESAGNPRASAALNLFKQRGDLRPNPRGIPSLWYIALVGGERFFDGFGFAEPQFSKTPYDRIIGWTPGSEPDCAEAGGRCVRPLLPFLLELAEGRYPQKWDSVQEKYVADEDWLILDQCIHTQDQC